MTEQNKTISEDLKDMFDSDTDRSGQAEALKQMYSDENVSMKTEFNKGLGEADEFARMTIIGKMLKIPVLANYVNEAEKKRVSNDRKSREEAVRMIQQAVQEPRRGGFLGMFR